MEIIKSIIIAGLFLSSLGLIGYIFYLKYIRKPTRERFAFFAVTTIVTLGMSVVFPVISGSSIVNIIIFVINYILTKQIEYIEIRWTEQILTTIVYFAITAMIYKIYYNWDSPSKSEREVENLSKNISSNIVEDVILFIKNDKSLAMYDPSTREYDDNFLGEMNYEKLPWYANVAEILSLISNQYSIDINNDWYKEQQCFISTYGINQQKIAVYCVTEKPTQNDINQVLSFIKSQTDDISKLIIAIEFGEESKQSTKQDNITIEKRYKHEMLDSLVDFQNYHRYLEDTYYNNEISQATDTKLKEIYVPLSGRYESNDGHIENIEDFILTWTKDKTSNKHLAVLGDYGQGKSVLSIKLALELMKNRNDNDRIPILIELRGKSPRNLSMQEIVATWATHYRLDATAILKLHYEGRLLIIFEGFDEMDLVGDMSRRLEHFRNLWEFAKSPKAKIIITGRPNFFLDDKEQKQALGIHQPIDKDIPYCQAVYLNNLSKSQIEQVLRKANPGTKKHILQLIESNKNTEHSTFYDLVSRPSTLFLVSSVWQEAKLAQRKENINSAIVIREFIQSAYERQVRKTNDTPLTVKERQYFMLGIAVGMMDANGYSNQISSTELNKLILKLYDNFPEALSSTNTSFEKVRQPLKQRFKNNDPETLEAILTDVRACGILVRDTTRSHYFKFSHKSFLECLVSEFYLMSLLQDDEHYIYLSIKKSLTILNTKATPEVIQLIVELIASNLKQKTFDNNEKLAKEAKKMILMNSGYIENKFLNKIKYYLFISNLINHVHRENFQNFLKKWLMPPITLLMLIFIFLSLEHFDWLYLDKLKKSDARNILNFMLMIIFVFMINLYSPSLLHILLRLKYPGDYKYINYITKMQIWYLTCQEIGINRSIMKKTMSSLVLKELEKLLKEDKLLRK